MRVMVVGLRGFPEVQGGVERHAEELYPLLVRLGCDVEVLVRTPHHPPGKPLLWQGVRFRRLWAPRAGSIEAFFHSFIATLYAAIKRPDILHIHAVGPALMAPLARLFGLRVVVTHHGPDYNREKWNRLARWVLRTGERWGMRYAHERIVISDVIDDLVKTQYGRRSTLIPNGVRVKERPDSDAILRKLDLCRGKYVLQVSRLVREKRQLDLIRAFAAADLKGWKLVLVGGVDTDDAYTREICELAERTSEVVLAGFQTGRDLQELYSHAGLFVLPSSHEGLPIALLEALSHGLPTLASDISANVGIGLPPGHYFPLGNTRRLAASIRAFASQPFDDEKRRQIRAWVSERYDWDVIAKQTMDVYLTLVPPSGTVKPAYRMENRQSKNGAPKRLPAESVQAER